MPRKHRRRAHQQGLLHDTYNTATRPSSSPQLSPSAGYHAFNKLAEDLLGVLSVRIQEPFLDLTTLCPRDASLVIHLDLLRFTPQKRDAHAHVRRALDAVATLCVVSERLHLTPQSDHESFWKRVLSSDIDANAYDPQDRHVGMFTRFTKYHGMRVLLSWSGSVFQPGIFPLIRAFLSAQIDTHEARAALVCETMPHEVRGVGYRPARFGLRLADCRLSTGHLVALKEALVAEDSSPGNDTTRLSVRVFDSSAIYSLELDGLTLGTDELKVLTTAIEASSREITSISLARTFPVDAGVVTTRTYAREFKALLDALFTSKDSNDTSDKASHGVDLDLSDNTMVDSIHLRSLSEALSVATRPLAALRLRNVKTVQSLSHSSTPRDSIRNFFACICVAGPEQAYTADCTLDLSMTADFVDSGCTMLRGDVGTMIFSHRTTIAAALAKKEMVECRFDGCDRHSEEEPNQFCRLYGSQAPRYGRITRLREDGWSQIDLQLGFTDDEPRFADDEDSDGGDTDEDHQLPLDEVDDHSHEGGAGDQHAEFRWVHLNSMTGLRIGSDSVVGMRFSSLIWDGNAKEVERYPVPDLHSVVYRFVGFVGRDLHHLSLRHWRHRLWMNYSINLPDLEECAYLRQLDISTSHPEHMQYTSDALGPKIMTSVRLRLLQVLNIAGVANVGEFLGVMVDHRGRKQALRSLSLYGCRLTNEELQSLEEAMQGNQTLEFLELDDIRCCPGQDDDADNMLKLKDAISLAHTERNHDWAVATRHAFLAGLRTLRGVRVDRDAVANVFSFVSHGRHLRANWYKSS